MPRVRFFVLAIFFPLFLMLFFLGGACSPEGGAGTISQEKGGGGQGGGERVFIEGAKEKIQDVASVEKGAEALQESSSEPVASEEITEEKGVEPQREAIEDAGNQQESGISEAIAEVSPSETAPERVPEPRKPLCVLSKGYCSASPCKRGYAANSSSMGCSQGEKCCLPVTSSCGKEGQIISLMQRCCPGLKKGPVAKPPSCMTIGQKFVCVKCGDGKCDAKKGENACSCPQDCKATGNQCVKARGRCINSRMMCRPDEKVDRNLSCNSKMLICCLPKTPPRKCKTDADCPRRHCTNRFSSCYETSYRCKAGICQTVVGPSLPNTRCDSASGKCQPMTGGCRNLCDCPQGLTCAKTPRGGRCVAGIVREYCCDNPGCPAGKPCTHRNGTKGVCRATNSCTQNKGVCVGQFNPCPRNYVKNTKYSCNAKALYCCTPSIKKCKTDADCPKPSCRNGLLPGSCMQESYVCSQGQCVKKSKTVKNAACTSSGLCKSGNACTLKKGYCAIQTQRCKAGYVNSNLSCGGALSLHCCLPATSKCKTDADCPKPSCRNGLLPGSCMQESYTCSRGQCVKKSKTVKNAACTSSGLCKSGNACTLKKGYCIIQTQRCKAGYVNSNLSCGGALSLRCCAPAPSKCKTSSDCGSTSCKQQGSVCYQYVPLCRNGSCLTKRLTMKGFCDMRRGMCR